MKNKIILSALGVILCIALLIGSAILVENEIINHAAAVILTAIAAVLVLIAVSYATKIDYETGVYECRKCGRSFKPSFTAYLCGAHIADARYLKCPECEEKSWCKRKSVKKENNHD